MYSYRELGGTLEFSKSSLLVLQMKKFEVPSRKVLGCEGRQEVEDREKKE